MTNQIVKENEQKRSVSWWKRINNFLLVLAVGGILMTSSVGCKSVSGTIDTPLGSVTYTPPC